MATTYNSFVPSEYIGKQLGELTLLRIVNKPYDAAVKNNKSAGYTDKYDVYGLFQCTCGNRIIKRLHYIISRVRKGDRPVNCGHATADNYYGSDLMQPFKNALYFDRNREYQAGDARSRFAPQYREMYPKYRAMRLQLKRENNLSGRGISTRRAPDGTLQWQQLGQRMNASALKGLLNETVDGLVYHSYRQLGRTYGLEATTIRRRYLKGLRGDALIKPNERANFKAQLAPNSTKAENEETL